MKVLLRIDNVTKNYKGHLALAGITLDLYQGEIITLLGANGAGKTTLSSIIASLYPPTSGDVIYCGTSIYKDLISFRKKLGFCPQKPNFADRMTVREHLIFAGRYFLIDYATIVARVNELMDNFGLHQYADQSPAVLSGGYKQRLLIARSMVHKPSLIIL